MNTYKNTSPTKEGMNDARKQQSGFNHLELEQLGLAGVKEQFDILAVTQHLTGLEIKTTGGNYCRLEDESCPICGHSGSFTLFPESQRFECFSASCGSSGDVFDLLVAMGTASTPYDAANKLLRGELGTIEPVKLPMCNPVPRIEHNVAPERIQMLFADTAKYYQSQLESNASKMKALQDARHHSASVILGLSIGFATGNLHGFLFKQGYSEEEVLASGLVKKRKNTYRDLFPYGVYVFPHFGRNEEVSRFTFKDPKKDKQWQLARAFWLNGVCFYGEDSLELQGPVVLVEGEHDLISLVDAGWKGPVLATIGTLSRDQKTWMTENLAERQVVTFFDTDDAGDGYREAVAALGLKDLIQVRLPQEHKDIDEYLHSKAPLPLSEIVEQYTISVEPQTAVPEVQREIAQDGEPVITPIATFEPTDFNDSRNADRLVALVGHDLRYVAEMDSYLIYNGHHWEVDKSNQAMKYARKVGESIVDIGNRKLRSAQEAESDAREKFARSVVRFGNECLNRGRMSSMLDVAQASLAVGADELNADPMLLGVANGVINLCTGQHEPARREHLITRYSPVAYDANATCPRWEQFVNEVCCGDPLMVTFMQQCVGYWVTGRTDEQLLFFLYGHGCNGKSTFMSVIQKLLGTYAHQINSDVLLQNRFGPTSGPNAALTKLVGSRLVVANELPEGSRMNENEIKTMTGGDVIVARAPYAKTEMEYHSTFSLIMVGNHKPVIRDTSHAMWRRMMILPFEASFEKSKLDPQLMDKLEAELPGILNWAIRGTKKWVARSIKNSIPPRIAKLLCTYQDESDLLGLFLTERTASEEGQWIHSDELYDAFKEWATRDGEWSMTRSIMTKKLGERGFKKGRKNNKAAILGLRLLSSYGDADSTIETPPEPAGGYSV
ncbi:phage/plasmid primase, P4 family [Ferrimonas sp. SCSIO 43195]|uniref:phage/plasmid primase, P4 family n=1 Tax=Ferrimonas sp. SCSIO 43195 TaxID=2822844 RepID=UPI002074D630|nr:phage/plasmid primase, P4 family [Ferrimonas sp. SCSIO 43195]USD35991.1 toprim domain-containing protein [Ferrimonas sp. SCSIO 43195]